MRDAVFISLDDDTADGHRHAAEIGVDAAFNRIAHEIERHRPLREAEIDRHRRNQQNG